MNEIELLSSVNWSRAQFALTAMYHFMFVPLTLGLSFIVAMMNTMYVRTNDPVWKSATRFWMTLFGINFAIGVATGLIMEFEFGTNWSNYSWFVGDIFGAPLAAEGIIAFFLEATFIAVMFFGWERVSKRFHLISTWLVAFGANMSALWILIANGWMQYPAGMKFNPDTLRNEMQSFAEVALSPVAITKFLHTTGSGYIVSAIFVISISAWYVLKKRHIAFARRSMAVAASFGLVMSLFIWVTGDEAAYELSSKQPVKLAAMEGHYVGAEGATIYVGILNHSKQPGDNQKEFIFAVPFPKLLSILGYRSLSAYVPGINDFIFGNAERGIEPAASKIAKGKEALKALAAYKEAGKAGNANEAKYQRDLFEKNVAYMGYGYLEKPTDILPPIALTYYTFHVMVGLAVWFVILFAMVLYIVMKKDITTYRKTMLAALYTLPLGYLAAQCGWAVAEVGRQPWAIQDLMPVGAAATRIAPSNIMLSFTLFAVLFTVLLIAEIKIMVKQIQIGPKGDE